MQTRHARSKRGKVVTTQDKYTCIYSAVKERTTPCWSGHTIKCPTPIEFDKMEAH